MTRPSLLAKGNRAILSVKGLAMNVFGQGIYVLMVWTRYEPQLQRHPARDQSNGPVSLRTPMPESMVQTG